MENITDVLSVLDGVTSKDVENLQPNSSIPYENYLIFSKSEITPILRTIEPLSKISTDTYAKNLNIECRGDKVLFRYNNDPCKIEYEIENRSGNILSQVSIPINHLKKLLGTIQHSIIFVEQNGSLNVCIGDHLLYVETTPFDPQHYDFKFLPCESSVELPYLKTHFRSFTNQIAQSSSATERQLICKGGVSYFNSGSVLGKARSFFGEGSMVISKPVLDSINSMVEDAKIEVLMNIADRKLTLSFDGVVRCELLVTTDDSLVDSFLSPLLLKAFNYDTSATIAHDSFRQLLQVIGAMDYFSPFIRLSFRERDFSLLATPKTGSPVEYVFSYLEGSNKANTMNVGISTLLSVISRADFNTKYSTSTGNMIIDLGDAVYCVRGSI